jgi:hypothetical protein
MSIQSLMIHWDILKKDNISNVKKMSYFLNIRLQKNLVIKQYNNQDRIHLYYNIFDA